MIDTTISHYKILEKLGEGGMGVVYKARDSKLERDVALKFLPPHLNASEDEKARFVQEAKAASALNHPNVCTIHDIQEHDKRLFIVMEYVEGKTLADRKENLSLKQALEICIQVAEGLAAAHEKGIVHRDIKPENIMIRKDGIAQIMDFGLAKLRGVTRLTKEGSTVGTAGYMAPEQIQGEEVDHRADIFSLGVLLYELVTGQAPFKGVHETALLYEIVNVDATPMTIAKPDIDPELDRIVLECLEKDPNERTQSAKQVAIDLKRFRRESGRSRVSRVRPASRVAAPVAEQRADAIPPAETPGSRSSALPWLIAGIVAALAVGALAFAFLRPGPALSVVRSAIQPPQDSRFAQTSAGVEGGHIALSPDGSRLAFVAADTAGEPSLWVRPLNSLRATRLPNTVEAYYPFWSPDNQYIGFFAGGKLKKVLASGGPPLTLCDAVSGRGGAWNQHGEIIFSPNFSAGIFRVSEDGGTPEQITVLDTAMNEGTNRWPWFLPDGRHFLYFSRLTVGNEGHQIYVGSLDGSVRTAVLPAISNMAYARGFLFFVRDNVLLAQHFDTDDFRLSGNAVPVADGVSFNAGWSRAIFSVSGGSLVYQTGDQGEGSRLAWFSRSGEFLSAVSGLEYAANASISNDGKRIVLDVLDPQSRNEDIWVHDIARGANTRLTFDESTDRWGVFSPDGARVVFSSNRNGRYDIFQKNADGTGNVELVYSSSLNKAVTSWSSDGEYLSITTFGVPETSVDIWTLPLTGSKEPFVFVREKFEEANGTISPDMQWVAYSSDETGRPEIYVRPFQRNETGGGGKWQVSTDGANGSPVWSADGRMLYFGSTGGRLMVVDVRSSAGSFEPGIPRVLFEMQASDITNFFGVTADGQRVLVKTQPATAGEEDMNLIMNWESELAGR